MGKVFIQKNIPEAQIVGVCIGVGMFYSFPSFSANSMIPVKTAFPWFRNS